jgi:hypothetical protein
MTPADAARRHAANIAAAQEADYRVIDKSGRTLFCSNQAPTGSHIAPGCLTEREWEQRQSTVFRLPWCPAIAESCGERGHSLVVLVDSP